MVALNNATNLQICFLACEMLLITLILGFAAPDSENMNLKHCFGHIIITFFYSLVSNLWAPPPYGKISEVGHLLI